MIERLILLLFHLFIGGREGFGPRSLVLFGNLTNQFLVGMVLGLCIDHRFGGYELGGRHVTGRESHFH